jgi:hypothetical protein
MGSSELPGYTRRAITGAGFTRDVYVAGSGPAVVIMHEVPGRSIPGSSTSRRASGSAGCPRIYRR